MFEALTIAREFIVAVRPLVAQIELRDRNLADQLRRAATSVMLNLGEGEGGGGRGGGHVAPVDGDLDGGGGLGALAGGDAEAGGAVAAVAAVTLAEVERHAGGSAPQLIREVGPLPRDLLAQRAQRADEIESQELSIEHGGSPWLGFARPRPHAQGPCVCLLYTSPSPRDRTRSRMPSSA